MAIEEINQAGGLLGKKIEPVIEDGASIGLLLQKRQRNCSKMTRLQPFSDAGLQPAVKPYCRCLKKITDFCGIQSPLGERLIVPTFGPSGRHDLLNCWLKKRFTNTFNHFFIVSSVYLPSKAFFARISIFPGAAPYLNI